jgi:hypothetical protein
MCEAHRRQRRSAQAGEAYTTRYDEVRRPTAPLAGVDIAKLDVTFTSGPSRSPLR